jgi:hypothetical protein
MISEERGRGMFKQCCWILLILLVLGLSSCASSKVAFRYDSISYDSPEAALAAQKRDIESILSSISPTQTPVGGSAIVIIPSTAYAKKQFVVWKGPEPAAETKDKSLNFVALALVIGWRMMGDAIDKRRIFDTVIINESDDPENAASSEDIAIVLLKHKEGKGRWFVRRKNGRRDMIPIEEMSTALPPMQRTVLWLDKVENVAKRLYGK